MKPIYALILLLLTSQVLSSQDKIILSDSEESIEGNIELEFNNETDALVNIIVTGKDEKNKKFSANKVKYIYLNDEKHFILPILGKSSDEFLLKYLEENESAAILIECNQDGPVSGAHIFISKDYKEVIRVETVLNMNKFVKKKFSKCKAAVEGAQKKKYSKKLKGLELLLADLDKC